MDIQAIPRFRRWRVFAAVGVVGLGVVLPASWIEAGYSRGIFPWIQAVMVPVFGRVPFPIMGGVLALLPIALAIFAWRRWRRGRRADVGRGALWKAGTLRALRWVLYLGAVFLLVWGLGYRRIPIEIRWRLGHDVLTNDQVREVQARLLALIHRDCPTTDSNDEVAAWQSICRAEVDLVTRMEGWTPATPTHIKHSPPGMLMAFGIFGIVSPFTLEANVDAALPKPIRLGICAHELAHLLGYCGEADANLVSFVAGLGADDSFARYGTALTLMRYAMSKRHLGATWLYDNLPPRARQDLETLRDTYRKFRIAPLSNLSSAMNDRYLRTVGVKLGTDDYSRGFTLFVRAWQKGLVELPPPHEPRQK